MLPDVGRYVRYSQYNIWILYKFSCKEKLPSGLHFHQLRYLIELSPNKTLVISRSFRCFHHNVWLKILLPFYLKEEDWDLGFFFFLDSGPEKSVLGYEKIKANKIYLTYYVRITCILPFVEVRWPMSWF